MQPQTVLYFVPSKHRIEFLVLSDHPDGMETKKSKTGQRPTCIFTDTNSAANEETTPTTAYLSFLSDSPGTLPINYSPACYKD